MAAAVFPAAALAACPLGDKAVSRCDAQLRAFDGTDVFALAPRGVMRLAWALGRTESLLRHGFPNWTYAGTLPLRAQLRRSARLGRIYARAYRADPTDASLPQEAAFENALLDLRRVSRAWGLPQCSVRLARQ